MSLNQKGFANIALIIVIVVIIAGGIGYLILTNRPAPVSDTTAFQNDLNPGNQVQTPGSNTNTTQPSKTPVNETTVSKTGWTTTTNQQLGIRFEHPVDASISSVVQRETTDGTTISELIVTPVGVDATSVHFFSTNVSLGQAKSIQIYGLTNVKSSEFTNAMIDGLAGTRRIDHYLNNDCTNELVIIKKNTVVYGSHIVQCPTHPNGYDQLRRDIASSLKLL